MWYNVYCAISKYPNMYCTAQFATEGWSGRDMSNVIVKENESLDSALRRFKRNFAKAVIQQEILKREHY